MGNIESENNSVNFDEMTVVIPQEQISSGKSGVENEQNPDTVENSRKFRKKRKFFLLRRTVIEDTLDLSEKTVRDVAVSEEYDEKNLTDVSARYQIASTPFATGGQGSISSAIDRNLGCEVALKSLHKHICNDDSARNAFFTEAQVTATLDHPAIIPIHGLFGDSENGLHLAMKLIDGYTLKTYLTHIVQTYEIENIHNFDERRSLRNRLDTFLRVCDAVEYAHERKILHRDLKPENIMIGKHRETYVTDWGIASRIGGPASEKLKGTPAYIAPEVVISKKADVRSDIYSLGVILFELVFLKQAFPGTDINAVIARVKAGKHTPLRHLFKCRIEADLKAIVQKAIAVDPEKRYQKLADLSSDLRRYLANEEVQARPDNILSKLGRWGINNRRKMIFTVMTVLLLGIGSIAYTLHHEIRGSWEKHWHDRAAGTAVSAVMATSSAMETRIHKVEYLLDTFRMNILFSTLEIEVPGYKKKNEFVTLEEYRKNPPRGFTYSPAYRMRIDFDNVCLFDFNKRKLDPARYIYFANTANFMRKMLFDLVGEEGGRDRVTAHLRQNGSRLRTVYFALENGLFAVYPGMTDFPADYFPPNRNWYKEAQYKDGRPVWTAPYRDIGSTRELITTCAVAVKGMRGKFLGVAAIDFSLSRLAAKMLQQTGRLGRFTQSKILVNKEGEVVFDTNGSDKEKLRLPDEFLFRRMFRQKYGSLVWEYDGKRMLYAFARIPSLDILYVECLDFEALVEYIRASTI
ncbi:MAG: protein kinase [Lentisphaeria bacterium]|nr:protein kinase [Lentisphaeria bacterium]